MIQHRRQHSRTFRLAVVLVFCIAPQVIAADPPEQGAIRIGLRKQLFVDDFLIAEKSGVTRELGQVTKANDGKPVFTEGWFYGTVLFDEGRFKMWWRKPANGGFGLAESTDGLQFKQIADIKGIKFAGDYTLAVTIDTHETDPAFHYLAAFDAPGMAAGIAHSADGISWTALNDGKPVTSRAADTYNQILWDEDAKTYRLFTRTDFGTGGGKKEWRGTRTMTNADLKQDPKAWKTVRNWAFDREGKQERGRRQVYSLTDWMYQGVHFALMSVYEFPGIMSEGGEDLQRRHERDVVNYYIATSRDADTWDLSWVYAGKPIVPRGPDGAFDKDMIFPASSIVTHADKHWLYYAGLDERHGAAKRNYAIGLATLRLDGFVGLEAKGSGSVLTKPFLLEGDRLQFNVDAAAGEASIEILDGSGKGLAGFSGDDRALAEQIDELRWEPKWKEGRTLAGLKGKVVRLQIQLKNATLYSFQVTNPN